MYNESAILESASAEKHSYGFCRGASLPSIFHELRWLHMRATSQQAIIVSGCWLRAEGDVAASTCLWCFVQYPLEG
jgi:hypothetical protein